MPLRCNWEGEGEGRRSETVEGKMKKGRVVARKLEVMETRK